MIGEPNLLLRLLYDIHQGLLDFSFILNLFNVE